MKVLLELVGVYILVVDDDEDIFCLFFMCFWVCGFRVFGVGLVEEVLV